jgi:hypothetical protein
MIASAFGKFNIDMKKVDLVPLPDLTKVLRLLLNPNVTEFNCTVFDSIEFESPKFNNFLLNHALVNCPKMSKIELNNRSGRRVPFKKPQFLFPIERFKQSWNNLLSIQTSQEDDHGNYICTDDFCNEHTLEVIQQNFPNIELVFSYLQDKLSIYLSFVSS